MTEVRTTSSTGGQKGVKPERHDLIPRKGTAAIARVFGFGANKYADHNWRRGYEWSKSISAMQRHIDAFVDGETYDEESGLPHLAHAGFHVLVLLTWLEEQGEGVKNPFDDRWPVGMRRAKKAAKRAAKLERQREINRARQHRSTLALDGLEPEEPLHGTIQRGSVLDEGWTDVPVDTLRIMLGQVVTKTIPARFVVGVETEDILSFGPSLLHKRPPRPVCVEAEQSAIQRAIQRAFDLRDRRGD